MTPARTSPPTLPVNRATLQNCRTIAAVIVATGKNPSEELLKPEFREGNATNPLFGHCYHSAEALYHLTREFQLQEDYLGFRPCRGAGGNNIPHI